jgi:transglutaminase/protease-like cytokinesis protein 3
MTNADVCLTLMHAQSGHTAHILPAAGYEAQSPALLSDKDSLSTSSHEQCEARSSSVLYELWLSITSSCTHTDHEEVVRSFYTWIITHIKYDIDAFTSLAQIQSDTLLKTLPVTSHFLKGAVQYTSNCDGENAVCNGKGLCTGFTDILYHLCW